MSAPGKTKWFVPDCYLPSSGIGEKWEGHEAICVINAGEADAKLRFDILFEDREPLVAENLLVRAMSNRHIVTHKPEVLNGVEIPRDVPYGIVVTSDVPVVCQYSRLDVTQPNFTLMTTVPYGE